MFGHYNNNKDEKKVSYEYTKQLPIVLQGTLTQDRIAKWAKEGRTSVIFETVGVDKIFLRQISTEELQTALIAFKEITQDIEELLKLTTPVPPSSPQPSLSS